MKLAYLKLVCSDNELKKRSLNTDAGRFLPYTGSRRFSFYQAVRVFNMFWRKNSEISIDGVDYKKGSLSLVQPALDGHISSMLGDIRYDRSNSEWSLECNFYGLFGPNGPLPTHLNDKVRECEIYSRIENDASAAALPDFLNIFNNRLLTLFHDIWCLSEPTAQYGNEGCSYISALRGIAGNVSPLSNDIEQVRLNHALSFSGGKPTNDGLRRVLGSWLDEFFLSGHSVDSDSTDYPVAPSQRYEINIHENIPNSLAIPEMSQARLAVEYATANIGVHTSILGTKPVNDEGFLEVGEALGEGAYLGSVIPDRQYRVAIEILFNRLDDYTMALPGGLLNKGINQLLREYLGLEYSVELWATLAWSDVPHEGACKSSALGYGMELGRKVWLRPSSDILDGKGAFQAVDGEGENTLKMQMIH